jgi:hypothetical protein
LTPMSNPTQAPDVLPVPPGGRVVKRMTTPTKTRRTRNQKKLRKNRPELLVVNERNQTTRLLGKSPNWNLRKRGPR